VAASEWDDYAADWDGNNDVQIYAQNAFASWKEKVAPLYANTSTLKVLDFGCGTGLLTLKLAACCKQVVAVDTSKKMLDVLKRKLAQSNVENIATLAVSIDADAIEANPELLGEFDLVVASSVCSFVPDYPSTLSVLSSIMKPGAFFAQWDWSGDMPEERIRNAFGTSGLTVQNIAQAFSMESDGENMPVIMGIGRKQIL
jgi:2-polyprenyl-3-methyl-5-hydroxy-6-metoxy-1,4-benzoquinol methylase